METYIYDLHKKFYITQIKKISFNFPCLLILVTQNNKNKQCESFKWQGSFQDVLCSEFQILEVNFSLFLDKKI